ncbi:hypothetical protein [Tenacibaculum soleae]|uniref:hypothetical protein n=1 Tax=Tenacibaculum soleae TaxID=447689 RepID=UPI0026E219D2|nr:hypothetical protein [Tenacibaculum soleae]MDO6813789.1 hypothetical protein [Tenacibaculum soleae]
MNKITNIKERIKEFAENTGENKELFFEKIGATSSNFRGKKLNTGVNADLIEKIVTLYPDVNLHWLITGEKKETKEIPQNIAMEKPSNYGNSYRDKYFEVLEENRVLSKKVISLLESNNNLKKDTGIVYK